MNGYESNSRRCPFFQTEEAISKYQHANSVGYVHARAAAVTEDTNKAEQRPSDLHLLQGRVETQAVLPNRVTGVPGAAAAAKNFQDNQQGEIVNDNANFPSLSGNIAPATSAKRLAHRRRSSKSSLTSSADTDCSPPNLSTDFLTILSMLREMSQFIDLPLTKSVIKILDVAMLLTGLLFR